MSFTLRYQQYICGDFDYFNANICRQSDSGVFYMISEQKIIRIDGIYDEDTLPTDIYTYVCSEWGNDIIHY